MIGVKHRGSARMRLKSETLVPTELRKELRGFNILSFSVESGTAGGRLDNYTLYRGHQF